MDEEVNYRKGLQSAVAELRRLMEEKERVEVEIARQQRKVAAWAELCDDSAFSEPFDLGLSGLTEACRSAMRGSRKEWLTISEIAAALKELGFPLDKYKAPTASITTTVNRMVESGEAASVSTDPGATKYKWVSQIPNFEEQLHKFAEENSLMFQEAVDEGAARFSSVAKAVFKRKKS